MSTERTFETNLDNLADCEERLVELHGELLRDLERGTECRRIHKLFLKLKFADFTRTTVERLGQEPLLHHYERLLEEGFRRSGQTVRLMGVGVRFAEARPDAGAQMALPFRETSPDGSSVLKIPAVGPLDSLTERNAG